MAKVRYIKQSLSFMMDGNRILDQPNEVSEHVVTYFRDLFTADATMMDSTT